MAVFLFVKLNLFITKYCMGMRSDMPLLIGLLVQIQSLLCLQSCEGQFSVLKIKHIGHPPISIYNFSGVTFICFEDRYKMEKLMQIFLFPSFHKTKIHKSKNLVCTRSQCLGMFILTFKWLKYNTFYFVNIIVFFPLYCYANGM